MPVRHIRANPTAYLWREKKRRRPSNCKSRNCSTPTPGTARTRPATTATRMAAVTVLQSHSAAVASPPPDSGRASLLSMRRFRQKKKKKKISFRRRRQSHLNKRMMDRVLLRHLKRNACRRSHPSRGQHHDRPAVCRSRPRRRCWLPVQQTAAAPSSAAERQQQRRCYCVVPNSSADGRDGGQATATGRQFVETTSDGIFDGLSYDSPSPLRFAENPQAVLDDQRQRERWWRPPILPGVAVAASADRALYCCVAEFDARFEEHQAHAQPARRLHRFVVPCLHLRSQPVTAQQPAGRKKCHSPTGRRCREFTEFEEIASQSGATSRRRRRGETISSQFARRADGHGPPKGQHVGRREPFCAPPPRSHRFLRAQSRADGRSLRQGPLLGGAVAQQSGANVGI